MRLCVLNGSPKGNVSVTMQYVKYLRLNFSEHEFQIINISTAIIKLEKKKDFFKTVLSDISEADVVVWATPVHVLFVPGSYKRFVELIFEQSEEKVFKGKYAISITTSIHFYDHIAHNYLHGISDDLDMKYLGFFSADMNDLLKREERKRFTLFIEDVFWRIKHNVPVQKKFNAIKKKQFNYSPCTFINKKIKINDKKIVLVTDQEDNDNLSKVTSALLSCFHENVEIINLHKINVKGGCLGCCNCAYDNMCKYKDDFVTIYNDVICRSDILIWAGNIKDRYLSAKWKVFFDRSFFKGHSPALMGKQLVLIISGPLSQLPNLSEKLISYAEFQRLNLVDIITDEVSESKVLDELLYRLAQRLSWASKNDFINGRTFRGVGGAKVFRDEVWGRFRFPFYADYKSYKKQGFFDFPQDNFRTIVFNSILLFLCKIPSIRKRIFNQSRQYMVKPFKRYVDSKTGLEQID